MTSTAAVGPASTSSWNGGAKGVAPVKRQYIVQRSAGPATARQAFDDDAAESKTNPASASSAATRQRVESNGDADSAVDQNGEPIAKAPKLKGAARKRAKIAEAAELRKQSRGMNTARKFERIKDDNLVCYNAARGQPCAKGEQCRFSHSIADYLKTKPRDIRFPKPPTTSSLVSLLELTPEGQRAYIDRQYTVDPPFVLLGSDHVDTFGSIDIDTHCPVVAAQQAASSSSTSHIGCYAGWTCRFLGGHVRKVETGKGTDGTSWELTGDVDLGDADPPDDRRKNAPDELNWAPSSLAHTLRSRQYPLYLTDAVLQQLDLEKNVEKARGPILIDAEAARRRYDEARERKAKSKNGATFAVSEDDDDLDAMMNEGGVTREERVEDASHTATAADTARIRPSEKRRLDWFHDELYLAPLTTTGNLPFRRLCVSFGADITCGEMGLAESYMRGNKNEWSLVRRWEGERCFGTQVCGNKPEQLVPTAEILAREFPTGLDFIDVNCGCPIDLVYNKGSGSALLDHAARLGRIVRGMSAVTGDIPITVKLRTGTGSAQTTHKIFPRLKADFGVGAATLHGRTRQQRYKQTADWQYVKQCADALRASVRQNNEERPDEEWVHPIPVYGNGDLYCWQDYEANKAMTGVDGQMLARGALIKPWLFTEIKERRDWDISSRERLDHIRQLCSYGLTHWGSDSLGVNLTRRFVCEAQSFMHRYIPVGILEHLPVHMHDRPPPFVGRDPLETLLASSSSQDWVRITEMFLGKAPEEWTFTPKHKSNAYDAGNAGEDQG